MQRDGLISYLKQDSCYGKSDQSQRSWIGYVSGWAGRKLTTLLYHWSTSSQSDSLLVGLPWARALSSTEGVEIVLVAALRLFDIVQT